ncbi:putative transcription factor interactor and regulator CCHC(Zn) family [Helianthus anomalus]
MISHIKACELYVKERETNYNNSMLATGFSATPTTSNNHNAALISQGGFQMFSSSTSSKATPTSENAYFSGSPTPSTAPSTAASTAANPSVKNEMISFFTRQSKENLDSAASVINCLNAFAAGKLDPPRWSIDGLDQIHPDDVEEIGITWHMAMAAFRAKKFVRKTGRNKWDGLFIGSTKVPFELRCYNCHEPGHVARNYTKPKVNREQTPAQPAPPNPERALVTTTDTSTSAGGSTQSSALVVEPKVTFDWNAEIQHLNISAPENQTASDTIAFMTSAPEDQNSAPKDETSAENLVLVT